MKKVICKGNKIPTTTSNIEIDVLPNNKTTKVNVKTIGNPNSSNVNIDNKIVVDYNFLKNKPSINGVVLVGDKNGNELGLVNKAEFLEECLTRFNSDEFLQRQINELKNINDGVVDVVLSKADLDTYPTEKIVNRSVIIVLNDETNDYQVSYYRWIKPSELVEGHWEYIASDESGYTKAMIDALLKEITDRLDIAEDEIDQLQTNVENLNTGLTGEIQRATEEEQRIEGLVGAEETRAKGEEQRIEARFDDYRTADDQDIIDTGITNRVKSLEDTRDTFGDIITHNASEFATAEQGAKANSAIQGVQVNGTDLTPDANSKVNIQYATNTRYGVVKVDGTNFGIGLRSTGIIEIRKADDTKIEAKTSEYFPIVPANLNKAVMEGLGNNSLTWTDAYKSSACTTIGAATSEQGAKADSALQATDIIDNYSSTATDKALSAARGKDLNERLHNVEARGRYLSNWNCVTGKPATNPETLPYEYKTGDYYIVAVVGETNYKPNGSTYTGAASTTKETLEVRANDTYIYDGTNWILQSGSTKTVTFESLAGDPYDNTNLESALNVKVTGNNVITGATHTKITYDSKGLVTSGTDLTANDIPSLTLTKISDVTASASELNVLDGIDVTTTELNYVKGVTSNIQTQLNNKQPTISNLSTIESNAQAGKNAFDTIDTYGDVVTHNTNEFATASQGAKADTAIQPNDNVSRLTNDTGYITSSYHDNTKQDKIDSSNRLLSDLVDDTNQTNKFVSLTDKTRLSDLNVQYINQGQPEQTLDLQTIDNQKGSATYGFEYSTSYDQFSEGLVPQNRDVDESYAYAKLIFNVPSETTLTVTVYQEAENNYDYGTVSNLDQELSYDTSDDSTYKWRDKTYIGSQTIDFGTVSSGTHFVTFKYIKDVSSSTLPDLMAITEIKLGSSQVKKFIDYDTQEEISVGTVKSVNSVQPDSNGNVQIQTGGTNPTTNYIPYKNSSNSFSDSTLMYNSNAMAFTGKLHVGSTSPGSYYSKGRFTIYDNTPSQQVSSIALLNYGGGGGCGVAIDMYNTSANGGIPSGRFGVIDNGNYSGYLQLQVKKSGAQSNPLLPAMNIVPIPATNSLTTCVSFGQDEFNRVLFDLHKPEAITTITDSDKRWSGSGTTYQVVGSNKFNPRLLVAVGDIVSFNNFSTEATVTGIVSNSNTCQITTDKTLGSVSNANISVKKAYFKITDENYNTKVYIDPYGKLGIGTGTPAYDLDVSGTINATTDVKINGQSVALPSQTGQSGKFLTTDGTDASWGTLNALQNETTNTSSVNIVPISGSPSVINNNNVLIHSKLTNINNTMTVGINTPYGGVGNNSVCINGNHAQGGASVSIGIGAQSLGAYSVAVGPYTHADGQRNIALGYCAQISSSKSDVIQLGYGSDSSQESFGLYAGFAGYSNYKLLDGTTGLIPPARHASVPLEAGDYYARITVDEQGNTTSSWDTVSTDAGIFYYGE